MTTRRLHSGIMVIQPVVHYDERGSFSQIAQASALAAIGITDALVQTNVSVSKAGVFRGMHAQRLPKAQGKLVSCLQGAIWDVVIDVRRHSATYLQSFSCYLTAKSMRQIWVPAGFLHGFYALSDQSVVVYHTTAEYAPSYEITVNPFSDAWQINWPSYMQRSAKDAHAPCYDAAKHSC